MNGVVTVADVRKHIKPVRVGKRCHESNARIILQSDEHPFERNISSVVVVRVFCHSTADVAHGSVYEVVAIVGLACRQRDLDLVVGSGLVAIVSIPVDSDVVITDIVRVFNGIHFQDDVLSWRQIGELVFTVRVGACGADVRAVGILQDDGDIDKDGSASTSDITSSGSLVAVDKVVARVILVRVKSNADLVVDGGVVIKRVAVVLSVLISDVDGEVWRVQLLQSVVARWDLVEDVDTGGVRDSGADDSSSQSVLQLEDNLRDWRAVEGIFSDRTGNGSVSFVDKVIAA